MKSLGHVAMGIALLSLGAGMGRAQSTTPTIGHVAALVIRTATPRGGAGLRVTSPAFVRGGEIPIANTQYGDNLFPGLVWSRGPAGTKSYVVIVQGTIGRTASEPGGTSIHLSAYNLPASAAGLPAGLRQPPAGAAYGPNVHGPHEAYAGPHTHNATKHEYHFQVFALDTIVPADPAISIEALIAAMGGHVLASGETIGLAAKPADVVASTPIRTEAGLVSGVPGRDVAMTVYKGIPYAAPPVGALRWRAPVPATAWKGVRKAERFGNLCPQPGGEARGTMPMDEDCLTLNLWSGPHVAGEKRPVLVWIYGGGFIAGTGAQPDFDGEGLARKGVVVVTFNYRLGALGFLATPELSRESGHAASGNYGLLDDIALLKWVQRNIAAFGGDPARVTIAGQSAGAGSVGFLAGSPLAKGLFIRGIAQSHARDPRDPELRYLSISYRMLKNAEAAGSRYTIDHGARSMAQLRAMPWQKVIEGSDTIDAAVNTLSQGKPPLFRPVVDGWVIPRTYNAMLAGHTQNNVLMVAGNNSDESGAVPETAFAALRARTTPPRAGMPQTSVTLAGWVKAAKAKFGPMADEFLALYPASNDEEAALANNASVRDNSRISTWLWATAWGNGVRHPVYTYFWTHAPPGPGHDMRGAYHASEINYALGNLYAVDRPWTEEDRKIADTMSSYWANIIKSGDPNGPGLPAWPRFDARAGTVMQLGEGWAPIPVASPDKIDFWKRFFATQSPW